MAELKNQQKIVGDLIKQKENIIKNLSLSFIEITESIILFRLFIKRNLSPIEYHIILCNQKQIAKYLQENNSDEISALTIRRFSNNEELPLPDTLNLTDSNHLITVVFKLGNSDKTPRYT